MKNIYNPLKTSKIQYETITFKFVICALFLLSACKQNIVTTYDTNQVFDHRNTVSDKKLERLVILFSPQEQYLNGQIKLYEDWTKASIKNLNGESLEKACKGVTEAMWRSSMIEGTKSAKLLHRALLKDYKNYFLGKFSTKDFDEILEFFESEGGVLYQENILAVGSDKTSKEAALIANSIMTPIQQEALAKFRATLGYAKFQKSMLEYTHSIAKEQQLESVQAASRMSKAILESKLAYIRSNSKCIMK